MTSDTPDYPTLTPALRWTANALCLWGLCGKAACRRARQCRHHPEQCLARYAPLVPEEARIGVMALAQGRHDGVGDEVVRMHAPVEIAAIEDWTARVHAAARAQTPGGEKSISSAPEPRLECTR